MPLSLLLMCFTLRSLRLGIIFPVLSIAGSILLSFTCMLPVADHMHVASFAPNIMMVVAVALSVDYCLFCLSRWTEAVKLGADRG